MLHPNYEINIGSLVVKPDLLNVAISIKVNLSMNSYSDAFEGTFRINEDNKSKFKKEIETKVSLGYDDNLKHIFTGTIDSMNIDLSVISLTALSSVFSLSNRKIDRFYENQNAGYIVKDLAQTANVEISKVSDGFTFPYYAIDSNKNIYEHMKDLAFYCGYDLYVDPNNKLIFKKFEPKNKHELIYGKNIISLKKIDNFEVYSSVSVLGESPSGTQGYETSHWLTKNKIMGTFGDNKGLDRPLNQPFVKDEDTAKKIAEQNIKISKSNLISIGVEIPGNADIMLGDSVVIKDVPIDVFNGEYHIKSIEHSLSKSSGFITTVKCNEMPK